MRSGNPRCQTLFPVHLLFLPHNHHHHHLHVHILHHHIHHLHAGHLHVCCGLGLLRILPPCLHHQVHRIHVLLSLHHNRLFYLHILLYDHLRNLLCLHHVHVLLVLHDLHPLVLQLLLVWQHQPLFLDHKLWFHSASPWPGLPPPLTRK